MDHHHEHGYRAESRRALAIVLALTGAYAVCEIVGGWLTGSLALLADAGHMLGDSAALALALGAAWLAGRPATPTEPARSANTCRSAARTFRLSPARERIRAATALTTSPINATALMAVNTTAGDSHCR